MKLLLLPFVESVIFAGLMNEVFHTVAGAPIRWEGFCSINLEKIKPQNTICLVEC